MQQFLTRSNKLRRKACHKDPADFGHGVLSCELFMMAHEVLSNC